MPTGIGLGIGLQFGGGWSPGSLPGIQGLWLPDRGLYQDDGLTTPVAADSVVGGWLPQAGPVGALTQAATGLKPIYRSGYCPSGRPAVQFDGVDDVLSVASVLGIASVPIMTWAVIMRPDTISSAYRRILSLHNPALTKYRVLRSDFGPAFFEYAWKNDDASNSSYHVGLNSVDWYVLVVRDNGGALDYWRNGVKGVQQVYTSSATTPTTFAVGSGASGSGTFSGHIAGVAAYNIALGDAECASLSRWLGAYAGVAA